MSPRRPPRPASIVPALRMLVLAVSTAALGTTAGCLDPASGVCNDLFCPAGTVCAPLAHRCVPPAQMSACDGKRDADLCSVPGLAGAECLKGTCVATVCGDGIVERTEVCDDGNTVSCDGCSADCRSDETCGNGLTDCNEQCDRGAGNSDAPSSLCRPDCRLQRCGACRNDTSSCIGSCGDGIVNGEELCDALPPSGQTCLDFGYDVGNLRCSSFCTPGFGRCERLGFQETTLGTGAFLLWIWGSGPGDVYAVGDTSVVLRYDGNAWSPIDIGITFSSRAAFNGIWGSSARDIFVNNLGSMGRSVAELRNAHGTGHGKDANHKGLAPRYVRLVVNAATAVGVFLFECHTA